MTELDDEILPEALSLIDEFGKEMDYTLTTDGTYDPATRSKTGQTSTTYTKVKSAPPFLYEQKYIDGDLIQQGDLMTMIAGKDAKFTPEKNMKALFDGLTYIASVIKPFYSGESIAAWEIRLRNNG